MTHVAAQGVETGPVTTETRAPGTFVNIDTLVLVGGEGEARLTAALEAASNVGTVSVTADIQLPALVDIPAVPACDVQTVAGRTLTEEAAGSVEALGQPGAGVEAGLGALVGVDTLKYRRERESGRGTTGSPPYLVRVLVMGVAWLTLTPVAPQGVHTGPVLADPLTER